MDVSLFARVIRKSWLSTHTTICAENQGRESTHFYIGPRHKWWYGLKVRNKRHLCTFWVFSLLFLFLFFEDGEGALVLVAMRVYARHSYIKNAVFPRVQNPPALMSSRASGLVFVELRSKCSNGIRCGSASTLLQTLRSKLVRRCWIPPCLSATNQTAFFTRVQSMIDWEGRPTSTATWEVL